MIARRTFAAISCLAALGCGEAGSLEPCDIRQSACQRDVFLTVQEVRGSLWDPWLHMPPMRVISSERYRAELEAQRARSLAGERPYDYLTPALKLLHMIDPEEPADGQTVFTVGFVAAYYDSLDRSITIVDHGQSQDLRRDTRTLAHELVHAAQERDVGFATFDSWIDSLDSANAVGSLIEGEAMLYENVVDAKLRGLDVDHIGWTKYHADWIADTRSKIVADPSPYRLASSGLRYPLGSAYLTSAFVEGAQLGVRRALASHPGSTAQLIAGRNTPADRPPASWSCAYPAAPEGYQSVRADELGAYSLYALLTRLLPDDDARAWSLAGAWNGDRFLIYADADKQLGVVWLLRFRSEADAAALQEALAASPLGEAVQSELHGDRLHLFVASGELPGFDAWRACAR